MNKLGFECATDSLRQCGKLLNDACHRISGHNFPVAVMIMSRHLANEILKQAGIKQKI
jgi:hypothetical protein